MVKVYPPSERCATCGGKCCKKIPGEYSPADFEDLSFEGLKAEIEKGLIAIDWWEATPKEYYLRARHIGENIVHGSWGGQCLNLTDTGCCLPWEKRPLGCRALKPGERECRGEYSKEDSKNEWKAYSDVLERLMEEFR